MNRTARCIRMLQILKSRESVCTAELAALLDTNPRNIREYRKELEEAGFQIETIRGAGGGYRLDFSSVLPVPKMTGDEITVLRDLRDYLISQPKLPFSNKAIELLDEFISSNPETEVDQPIYFIPSREKDFPRVGADEIRTVRKAIIDRKKIDIVYHSRNSPFPIERTVDPYEIVGADGKWYFIGYDSYRSSIRTFSFSDKRLLEMKATDETFERDPEFNLRSYLGSSTLEKEDQEFYMVEVREEYVRLFEEIKWGTSFCVVGSRRNGWQTFSFFSDDPTYVQKTLFRLGDKVVMLSPKRRVEEYRYRLASILAAYQEEEDDPQ